MYIFGTSLLVSAFAFAALASVSYLFALRGNTAALICGRWCVRMAPVAVLLCVALLAYLFIAQRYDVQYIYAYSSSELPLRYRIAAMWAGQAGSFLIWVLWGMLVAQALLRQARRAEPAVLGVFMLMQAALLMFVLMLNPFVPYLDANGMPQTPLEGAGLNELLENPWMVIHPPVLLAGYTLLAVPFAFAIGGLARRDYDGWAHSALPWALAGWGVLGTALLLGGYWAYETLGWGGYWGWDAVENSGLVPWLTATALIHALLVQRARGRLRRTALCLAIITYLLVFYATYLTRSGVLAAFSVHTFALESLQPIMTAALAVLIAGSLALLIWRWRTIPRQPLSEYLLVREVFITWLITGMLVIAAAIDIATSMPLISALPGVGQRLQELFGAAFDLNLGTRFSGGLRPFADGRFALAPTFYPMTISPLGLLLLPLLIIGPLLGWRDTNPRGLLLALRWPFVAAVVVTSSAILLGVRAAYPLAFISLSALAAGANLVMLARTIRRGWLRIGGYLAHVGMAVLMVGVLASTMYAAPDQQVVLPQGQTVRAYGYTFIFNGWQLTPDNKGRFDVTVTRDGSTFQATPLYYFIPRRSATMTGPAIKRELWRDLYITPVSYQPSVDRNAPIFGFQDVREIGPYRVTFLGFDAPDLSRATEVGAKLRVQYRGQELLLAPRMQLAQQSAGGAPGIQRLPLPGGQTVQLDNVDVIQRKARIRINGLNLPTDPGVAVVTISLKPGIGMVWGGVMLMVLGGMIALVRRLREQRLSPGAERVGVPHGRGLPALPVIGRRFRPLHLLKGAADKRSQV